MSIEQNGCVCANIIMLKSTLARIRKSANHSFEINDLFLEANALLDTIQESCQDLEKGLEKRKEFLVKNNLEDKYQEYKKIKFHHI